MGINIYMLTTFASEGCVSKGPIMTISVISTMVVNHIHESKIHFSKPLRVFSLCLRPQHSILSQLNPGHQTASEHGTLSTRAPAGTAGRKWAPHDGSQAGSKRNVRNPNPSGKGQLLFKELCLRDILKYLYKF